MGIGLDGLMGTPEGSLGAKVLQFWWSFLRDQTPEESFRRPRDAMIQDPLRGHESDMCAEDGRVWMAITDH